MNPQYRPKPHYEEHFYENLNKYSVWLWFENEQKKPVLQCDLYHNIKEIFISDLHIGEEYELEFYCRKGYYTEIMEFLLKFAHQNNYKIITGELKSYDMCRRERQIHFYKKFGFVISEPDTHNNCNIRLEL